MNSAETQEPDSDSELQPSFYGQATSLWDDRRPDQETPLYFFPISAEAAFPSMQPKADGLVMGLLSGNKRFIFPGIKTSRPV